MRILNLNVGIKIDNTAEVVKLIRATGADIATFQEVANPLEDGCYDMYRSKPEFEKYFRFSHFAPLYCADKVTKNGEVLFEFGGQTEQGSLLLSNYKITAGENQFYYGEYKNYYDVTHFHEEDWCRSLQNITMDIDGQLVQILNVHGIWNAGKRGNDLTHLQTEFILSKVRYDIPCILLGDFNLVPESRDIAEICKHLISLTEQYSINSTRPPCKPQQVVDHIFVNDKVHVNNFEVIGSDASDHYPLVLDFEVDSPEA